MDVFRPDNASTFGVTLGGDMGVKPCSEPGVNPVDCDIKGVNPVDRGVTGVKPEGVKGEKLGYVELSEEIFFLCVGDGVTGRSSREAVELEVADAGLRFDWISRK